MRIDVLIPDAPSAARPAHAPPRTSSRFSMRSRHLSNRPTAAERAFAAHRGGLQEMVIERARADIALQIATDGGESAAQGVQTILSMQI